MYDDEFRWRDDSDEPSRVGWWIVGLVAAFIVLGLGLSFCSEAKAQDGLVDPRPQGWYGVGHAEHHQHYSRLPQTPAGYSCCSSKTDGECRPTQARFVPGPWTYHWGNQARTQPQGRWQAMVDGQWMDVPDGRVMDQAYLQSKGMDRWDEQAHVCASKFSRSLYCLIPPDGGN